MVAGLGVPVVGAHAEATLPDHGAIEATDHEVAEDDLGVAVGFEVGDGWGVTATGHTRVDGHPVELEVGGDGCEVAVAVFAHGRWGQDGDVLAVVAVVATAALGRQAAGGAGGQALGRGGALFGAFVAASRPFEDLRHEHNLGLAVVVDVAEGHVGVAVGVHLQGELVGLDVEALGGAGSGGSVAGDDAQDALLVLVLALVVGDHDDVGDVVAGDDAVAVFVVELPHHRCHDDLAVLAVVRPARHLPLDDGFDGACDHLLVALLVHRCRGWQRVLVWTP